MESLKAFSHSATGYVGPAGAVTHVNKFGGVVVTTATATAALLIRNGVGGTILAAIPVTSAIGYNIMPPVPIVAPAGVYLDLNGGTGTLTIYVDD